MNMISDLTVLELARECIAEDTDMTVKYPYYRSMNVLEFAHRLVQAVTAQALAKVDETVISELVSAGTPLERWSDVVEAPARRLTDAEHEEFLRGGAPGSA